MKNNPESEIQSYINDLRRNFLKYTREAYGLIPRMAQPRILDIGCGRGAQTLELAKLGDGNVVGIDIAGNALDELNLEIEQRGLGNRLQTLWCSFPDTDFRDESFDILWEEGVLHTLDAKRSLRECRRLLKSSGFLVMNETLRWFRTWLESFPEYDLQVVNYFHLPIGIWWADYYAPLEKRIDEFRNEQQDTKEVRVLRRCECEIELVKKNPSEFDCAFYIVQKGSH